MCQDIRLVTLSATDNIGRAKSIGLNTFTLVAENGLKKVSSTISVEVVPDVEIQLWLSKNKLRRGKAEQSQLQWNIQNAVSAELKVADVQQSVMLEGSKVLTSDSSVSIELSAIALDGVTRRSKIVELGVYDESTIVFKSDKNFTYHDVPVTLSWVVENSKEVKLEGEIVSPVGSKTVFTDKEYQYKLEVLDEFGVKQESLTVRMLPLPIMKSIFVPTPSVERKITVLQKIPAPKVSLKVEMNGIKVPMNKREVEFHQLQRLHPLTVKIGSSFWSRLKSAVNIMINKVESLKFESDE